MVKFGAPGALIHELTWRVALLAAYGGLVQFGVGIEQGWWGLMLGHPYFNFTFGEELVMNPATGTVVAVKLSTNQTSLGTSLPLITVIFGAFGGGFISHTFGRRRTFVITSLCIMIGIATQATASINGHRFWQLVAGKFVINLGVGGAQINSNVYQTEIAPKRIRGAVLNTSAWLGGLGLFIGGCIVYAVLSDVTSKAWMLPILLQLMGPVITVAGAFFIPESPRWLMEKGEIEKAKQSLQFLGRGRSGFDLETELGLLKSTVERHRAMQSSSFAQVFRKSNLKRTLAASGTAVFNNAQGFAYIGSYLVLIFISLGVKNVYQTYLGVTGMLSALVATGFFIQDFFGRRAILLVGASGCCCAMLVFGILGSVYPTPTRSSGQASLAMVIIWFLFYSQTWTGSAATAITETPSVELRDLTVAFATAVGGLVAVLITVITPYVQNSGYGNLGTKVGYIYASMSALAFFFVYFIVPDVARRSLEEIDYMWDHGVPSRRMANFSIPMGDNLDPEPHADSSVEIGLHNPESKFGQDILMFETIPKH